MGEADRKAQLEEIQSIESIYGDLIHLESSSQLSVRFNDVQLTIYLPKHYPTSSPPYFELSGPSMTEIQKEEVKNSMNEIYAKNVGQPVLYEWITFLNDYLADFGSNLKEESIDEDESPSISAVVPSPSSQQCIPTIISGNSMVDRKSTFQAHVAQVFSKNEVALVLNKLKENNKIARATHNMYAWLTEETVNGRLIKHHDCEDDGEIGAGAKLLNLLELMKAKNVLVIITRWYGGIHLGPDRFRHICNLARQILVDNGFSGRSS
uniref:RWD domain-containing protein n=1 Tax=Elaeophora elaphi TaxID=1147741 RepID=A0A0R3S6A9_9BILA